jgi:hypothetical protein
MIAQGYIALAIAGASFAAGGGLAWKYQGARIEACALARDGLGQQIKDQNAAIEVVRQRSDALQAQAANDAAKARAAAKAALDKANKRGPAPKTCDAAFDALDKE